MGEPLGFRLSAMDDEAPITAPTFTLLNAVRAP